MNHEILWLDAPGLACPLDVHQGRRLDTVPKIVNLFTPGERIIVRLPLRKLALVQSKEIRMPLAYGEAEMEEEPVVSFPSELFFSSSICSCPMQLCFHAASNNSRPTAPGRD